MPTSRCNASAKEVLYFRFALARYTAEDEWISNLGFSGTAPEVLDLVATYDESPKTSPS